MRVQQLLNQCGQLQAGGSSSPPWLPACTGGHAAGTRTNDLFLLDLGSRAWSQPGTSGTAPSPRQAPGICMQGNNLFVHGGRNNFVLEDLFVLDFMVC